MVDIYLSSRAEVASVILMMTLCLETGDDDRGGDEPGQAGGEDGHGGKRLPNARRQ